MESSEEDEDVDGANAALVKEQEAAEERANVVAEAERRRAEEAVASARVAVVQMAVARAAAAASEEQRRRQLEFESQFFVPEVAGASGAAATAATAAAQMRSRLLTCTRLLRELQAENNSLSEDLCQERVQRAGAAAEAAAFQREAASMRLESAALLREVRESSMARERAEAEMLQAQTALVAIVPVLERRLEERDGALAASHAHALELERRLALFGAADVPAAMTAKIGKDLAHVRAARSAWRAEDSTRGDDDPIGVANKTSGAWAAAVAG